MRYGCTDRRCSLLSAPTRDTHSARHSPVVVKTCTRRSEKAERSESAGLGAGRRRLQEPLAERRQAAARQAGRAAREGRVGEQGISAETGVGAKHGRVTCTREFSRSAT